MSLVNLYQEPVGPMCPPQAKVGTRRQLNLCSILATTDLSVRATRPPDREATNRTLIFAEDSDFTRSNLGVSCVGRTHRAC
jgi:hypothetical protein